MSLLLRYGGAGILLLLMVWVYYGLGRGDFWLLWALLCLLMGGLWFWGRGGGRDFFLMGLALRVLALGAWPALSEDYLRFVWDGHVWVHEGLHPMAAVPSSLVFEQRAEVWSEWLGGLNSPDYYSVYPWVCQLVFGLAAYLAPWDLYANLIILRLVLLLGELSVYGALRRLGLSWGGLTWYWLNPWVCLELMGNLHFEGLELAWGLWAWIHYRGGRWFWGGSLFLLCVQTKLKALMFLPLVWAWGGRTWGSFWRFFGFGLVLVLSFVLWLPWEQGLNLGKSLNLYFQTFEFNASVYYVLRGLAYWIWSYNRIALLGPMLGLGLVIYLVYESFRLPRASERELYGGAFRVYVVYLLLATTVHPWYGFWALVLALLGGIWPFYGLFGLSFLSYHFYYYGYESYWVLMLEYGLLFLAGVWYWGLAGPRPR